MPIDPGDNISQVTWQGGGDATLLSIRRVQYGYHPVLDGSMPYGGAPGWDDGDQLVDGTYTSDNLDSTTISAGSQVESVTWTPGS